MVCKSFLSNVFLFFFVNYFIFEFLFFSCNDDILLCVLLNKELFNLK